MSRCIIIGGGIVGLCCGIALRQRGLEVTLYDPESPGSQTSSGNAGGFGFTDVMPMAGPGILRQAPGWLLDPCGPLFIRPRHLPALLPWLWHFYRSSSRSSVTRLSLALAALLRASERDTKALVRQAGLAALFTEHGALTVYRTRAAWEKDRYQWQVKQARGGTVNPLTAAEIQAMEPALHQARYGWFTPQWCNTPDPFGFATGLADYLHRLGGNITRHRVQALAIAGNRVNGVRLEGGDYAPATRVIVAAGIWSRPFCHQARDRVLLEAERGYNTTLPQPGVTLNHQVIFGQEKFVITRIGNGLRIGGASEFAGLTAPPNFRRSTQLVAIARRYLPDLDERGATQWMGQRPTTPDSLPIIGPSPQLHNLIYAFGHGHYGLTMAAATGRAVTALVLGESSDFDLTPFSIARFARR